MEQTAVGLLAKGSAESKLEPVARALRKLEETYVEKQVVWYTRYISSSRFAFRAAGVLVILLSVSIPFIAAYSGPRKDLILSIVSLTIAGLTGLSSFFQWENTWRAYVQARMKLQGLIAVWELKIIEAEQKADPGEGIQVAIQATSELLQKATGITSAEASAFFASLQTSRAATSLTESGESPGQEGS